MSDGISFGLLDSMSLVLWAVYEGFFAGWIADIESNSRLNTRWRACLADLYLVVTDCCLWSMRLMNLLNTYCDECRI
jgi:hypothetical protein